MHDGAIEAFRGNLIARGGRVHDRMEVDTVDANRANVARIQRFQGGRVPAVRITNVMNGNASCLYGT